MVEMLKMPWCMRLLVRLICSALPLLQWSTVQAQCPGCGIDFACTASPAFPTLCPTQPPDATVGQPYQADITFWMPANFDDPGTGQNVDFNQMTITGINGLPFGLAIETSAPSGIYYPQSDQYGCARICGTPLGAGTYTITIDIIATVEVTALGFEVDVPQSFPITLLVLPGNGGNASFTFAPSTGCGSVQVQFEALIDGGGQPTGYAWDFGNGNTGSDMIPPPEGYGTPGTYAVTLTTTVGGHVLNEVHLNGVNDNWCGDVEEPYLLGCTLAPDLYFVLTDGGGGQYTSSSGSDSDSESWTGLGLLLDDPPYSIQFLDEDPISADDDLGTYNIPLGGAGSYPFTIAGGTNGELIIDLVTQMTFSDTDTVLVFPVPSITTSYDTVNAEVCAVDTSVISFTWFNDGDTVPGATGPCVQADSAGLWWAVGTNGYGCTATSDTVVVCPGVEILDGGTVLYVLGDFDSYQWSLNGTPIPGADGPVWAPVPSGMYSITVTTSYGCSLTDEFLHLITSVAGAGMDGAVQVLPSPNDGSFDLVLDGSMAGASQLRIVDASGREVFAEALVVPSGGLVKRFLGLDLARGRYAAMVSGPGSRRVAGFVVQH